MLCQRALALLCMQIQQEQLAQLRAELDQRKRGLEEAQRDLNQALEEYENEVGGAVLTLLGFLLLTHLVLLMLRLVNSSTPVMAG